MKKFFFTFIFSLFSISSLYSQEVFFGMHPPPKIEESRKKLLNDFFAASNYENSIKNLIAEKISWNIDNQNYDITLLQKIVDNFNLEKYNQRWNSFYVLFYEIPDDQIIEITKKYKNNEYKPNSQTFFISPNIIHTIDIYINDEIRKITQNHTK